jgi:hypothetical protein
MLLLNKILLIVHFIGLAMGLSVTFANIVMAGLIHKAAPAEKPILGRFPLEMSRVGYIGLTLLWVTGITMVFTRWNGFQYLPPAFHIKFTAVVLLTIAVICIRVLELRIRKGNIAAVARIQTFGKMAALFALIAIIFAVWSFN